VPRLVTINDLYDPLNDWKPLLAHVAALKGIFEHYKSQRKRRRTVNAFIPGDEDRAPGLHASELCHCSRHAAYSLINAQKTVNEEDADVNMQMRFDMGHMVHALLQDDFQRMCFNTGGKLVFEHELRIDATTSALAAQYLYQSSADGLFTFYDQEENIYLRILLEIKTKSAPEFDKIKQPDKDHVQQVSLYQRLLDVPLTWILYYNKSNSNYTPPKTPWLIPFDVNAWNFMDSRAKHIHLLASQNQLPDREEGRHCTWCPFERPCEPAYTRHAQSRKRSLVPRRLT